MDRKQERESEASVWLTGKSVRVSLLLFVLQLFAVEAFAQVKPESPASKLPWKTQSYTFTARNMSIRDVLTSFAMAQNINVIIAPTVEGLVSGDFRGMKPDMFLEQICSINNLLWYFDGSAIYFYRAGDIQSMLVDLKFMKASEVREMLGELGVEDTRFPLMTTSKDELVMVSGPPRYVELVQDMIAKADRLRQLRAVQEVDIRVFPVHNAWASDITLGTTGEKITIQGVASLLSSIMSSKNGSGVRMSGEPGTGGKEETADDRAKERMISEFTPVIYADSRLNAVIVRDVVTRLPKYEELIKSLDVPVQLIEIAITVLDINKDDVLNWELQLRMLANGKRVSGGAGSDVENVVTAEGLAGLGLTGSMMYLTGDYSFLSSLSTMVEKGKARTVSRPSILTLNNMEAELTDTKSYHAKVVGQEVAELREVSAGIELKVQPRIVGSPDNPKRQIWMKLELDDGGFESVSVDSMPMTRNSTIETQAAVYEGQSLLIGGYLRDIEEERKWGIPFLRDIPWIGFLFGGIGKTKTNVQRMFILTPRIIDLNEEGLPEKQVKRLRDLGVEDKISEEVRKSDKAREEEDEKRRKAIEEEEKKEKQEKKDKRRQEKLNEKKEAEGQREDFNRERKTLSISPVPEKFPEDKPSPGTAAPVKIQPWSVTPVENQTLPSVEKIIDKPVPSPEPVAVPGKSGEKEVAPEKPVAVPPVSPVSVPEDGGKSKEGELAPPVLIKSMN